MTQPNISFIGAGNMGASIIGGLITDGYDPEKIWASDINQDKLNLLQSRFKIQTTTDNKQAIAQSEVVVLALKPNLIKPVLLELADTINNRQPFLISIAAGTLTKDIQRWLGHDIAIVRCMPNTPALVSTCATGLYATSNAKDQHKEIAESLMRAVGLIIWFDHEHELDIVTALSGSGPAYFFYLIEALAEAATELGLSADKANLLTIQTALGAARMAMESEEAIAELRRKVTSPGGTTEAALEVLQQGQFKTLIANAIKRATKRADELANLE